MNLTFNLPPMTLTALDEKVEAWEEVLHCELIEDIEAGYITVMRKHNDKFPPNAGQIHWEAEALRINRPHVQTWRDCNLCVAYRKTQMEETDPNRMLPPCPRHKRLSMVEIDGGEMK